MSNNTYKTQSVLVTQALHSNVKMSLQVTEPHKRTTLQVVFFLGVVVVVRVK